MKKYPKIPQLRTTLKEIREYYEGQELPTIIWKGTVKLHGTNGGVVFRKNGGITYQSRNRELSLLSDNLDFYKQMSQKNLLPLIEGIEYEDNITIFGEWCGEGIQSGVGVSSLPKMFVIFDAYVDDKRIDFAHDLPEQGVYNILNFPTYEVSMNVFSPTDAINRIVALTEEVERCCPVAKHFGVEGIGEGIVFRWNRWMFKSKGEKHSNSKVKTMKEVNPEAIAEAQEFASKTVTPQRIEQGVQYLKEMDIPFTIQSTGAFLSWIVKDILAEEEDTVLQNNLDVKKVKSAITLIARQEYLKLV